MELCDMTLDDFIGGNSDSSALPCPVHLEFLFNEGLPAWWKTTENLKVLSQITSGLAFIHKNNYVHRDLKPPNSTLTPFHLLLIPLVLRSQTSRIWKISDFGLASQSKSTLVGTSQARGTNGYRAPELLVDEKYSSKSDMWALGCILFQMFMRKKAFKYDWQTVLAKESGTVDKHLVDKQIIDQIAISDGHGCVHCTSNLGNLENQIPVLKEVNETLLGLMSIQAKERPSARDLQELWKKWDE